MENINQNFPAKYESVLNIKKRCEKFRVDLEEIVGSTDGVGIAAKKGKVGIIGHSVFYRVYNARKEFWTDKYCPINWDHFPGSDFSH
jgi:hypothetical protein